MANVLVRDLDDDVLNHLKAAAKAHGRSLQAVISPASEAKMKLDGALPPEPVTTKSIVGLNTMPVGAPPGMLTTSGTITGMLRWMPPV